MATSLAAVAIAVPAYADSSSDATNPITALVPTTDDSASPGATTTPDPTDTQTAAPADATATPTDTATPTPSATSSAPAAGNPVTDLATCLATAGLDPTAAQKCLTDAASGLQSLLPTGGTGGGGGAPDPTTALTTFFTCAQGALTSMSTAAGEKCGTDLFTALGIAQAKCLDPTLQPLLTAIDGLIGGDPSKLETELTDLPNTLPGQLETLPDCLQGTTSATPTPSASVSPSASASTGTTTNSGGAVSDPTDPIAVAAEPTFTG
jgi:hypothetical protein